MENQRTIQMTTNFEGLIRLLADGLYSTSDIFVRELIQNGHDGIIRRQALANNPNFQGAISVVFDRIDRTISFSDNGIGMDENDIVSFLSVIGSTGTGIQRDELDQRFSAELIGQFGIGLLSSFLVAEKVDVLTRKINHSKAFLWSNSGSTECILRYDVERLEIGTTVTVYLRPEFNYLLDRAKLEEIIVRYCDFITVPIKINGGEHVNAIYAPWDRHYSSTEQKIDSYEQFVSRRFPDMSMDVFPIEIDTQAAGNPVTARGVLYISNRSLAGLNSTGVVDIFVRKMLVKEGDTSLLPSWAKFVRGVIDSPDLRPTAGRDNVNQDDPAFKAIQNELGNVIVDRLAYLAEHRPDKFAYINQHHHDNLKGMAMVNDEFFDKAAHLLLFETNYKKDKGLLSLSQYLTKNAPVEDGRAPIYYFAYYDSAAQYYRMADEKGITVINAGNRYDEELLEKYGKKHPETILEKLDVLDKGVFFEELTEHEREKYHDIEQTLLNALTSSQRNLVVTTKRFQPDEIPAVIIETEVEKTDRELEALLSSPKMRENFGEIFSSVRRRIRERPIQLALNANSDLIELLSKNGNELEREDAHGILMALYNNALLYSHRLDETNRSIVHDGVTGLMIRILQLTEEKAVLNAQLEQERADAIQRIRIPAPAAEKPKHIRLFMMTPFANEYKQVEEAARRIFEQKPFWFEVRLARDYYEADTLVKNVRIHIESSHGFIAEISSLSSNVMMEAGAVLMSNDERPMFAIHDQTLNPKDRPADFGDLLTFSYESRDKGAEAIAEDIRQQIFTDGRLSNAALKKLCAMRKEEHMKKFLSRSLLENLSDYFHVPGKDIEKICSHYSTVEDFLEADDAALSALKTGAPLMALKGLQEELRKQTEDSHVG